MTFDRRSFLSKVAAEEPGKVGVSSLCGADAHGAKCQKCRRIVVDELAKCPERYSFSEMAAGDRAVGSGPTGDTARRCSEKGAGDHGCRRLRACLPRTSPPRDRSSTSRSSVALKSSARTLPAPIETLDTKGADFRSLGDPIDTTSPQGRFTLQTVTAERA